MLKKGLTNLHVHGTSRAHKTMASWRIFSTWKIPSFLWYYPVDLKYSFFGSCNVPPPQRLAESSSAASLLCGLTSLIWFSPTYKNTYMFCVGTKVHLNWSHPATLWDKTLCKQESYKTLSQNRPPKRVLYIFRWTAQDSFISWLSTLGHKAVPPTVTYYGHLEWAFISGMETCVKIQCNKRRGERS